MEIFLIVLFSVLGLLILYFVYCFIVVMLVNKKVFGVRGKDPENPCYLRYEDYASELDSEPFVCGYYGKSICGYIYKDNKNVDPNGFIILSHGLFGTHVQYLMDVYMLCKEGYEVLAYDQYGVGESDGRSQEYLAHGIYVMENVIQYVKKNNVNHDLPIFLYGHSWGAYSALGAMRNYPDLKGVIVRGGPIKPSVSGSDLIHMLKPKLYSSIVLFYPLAVHLFLGRQYSISCLRGPKKNKTTPVLILHSKDDTMVPYLHSSAHYYENHPQNNVRVVLSEEGGHNTLITKEGFESYQAAVKEYKRLKKEGNQSDIDIFVSSLHRRDMYPYNPETKKTILDFLKENTKEN